MTSGNNTVLKNKAFKVLLNNHFHGINKKTGQLFGYTAPALPKYPHQWLWDSCFAAIVWSKIKPDYAEDELRSLLSVQRADGFVPSIIRWQGSGLLEKLPLVGVLFDGLTSRITQPPVIAQALEEVFKNTGDLKFVEELLPKVAAFYDYLAKNRDLDGNHLVSIIHPWESTDDSPAFDGAMFGSSKRPNLLSVYCFFYKTLFDYLRLGWNEAKILKSCKFNVENVLFNSLYAQGLRSLSHLYLKLGRLNDAEYYGQKADDVVSSLVKYCYDPETGLFYDLIRRQDGSYVHNRVTTVSSLFPLILDTLPKEIVVQLVEKHLANPVEFWLPYPVPFVAKSEPSFNYGDSHLLWRGPVWINTNWFLARGLSKHGYHKLACDLASRTVDLVKNNGWWEFYNPFTGKGEGQNNYSWSTLVLDLLDYC